LKTEKEENGEDKKTGEKSHMGKRKKRAGTRQDQ